MEQDIVSFDIYSKRILDTDDISLLEWQKEKCMQSLAKYSKSYIWDNNGVTFEIKLDNQLPYIRGKHYHGEGHDDEYFLLSFLQKLTLKKFELIIKIYDSQGDFPIIDSCDDLYSNDKNVENYSVYMYQGNLIPILKSIYILELLNNEVPIPNELSGPFYIMNRMNSCAEIRYKHAFEKQIEYTIICPHEVAFLLEYCPQAITDFVNKFDENYPVPFEVTRAVDNDCITLVRYKTKMTMTLCAKIFTSNVYPPIRSKWRKDIHKNDHVALGLGYRITMGYYLFKQTMYTRTDDEAIFKTQGWKKFKSNLIEMEYFKNEVEGSQKYSDLEHNACQFYKTNIIMVGYKPEDVYDPTKSILNHLKNYSADIDISSSNLDYKPQDVSWLYASYCDAEDQIKKQYQHEVNSMYAKVKMENFAETKTDLLKGTKCNHSNIEKNIRLDPISIDNSLSKILENIKEFEPDPDDSNDSDKQEHVQDMFNLMDRIGDELSGNIDDPEESQEYENLLLSFINQPDPSGPAANFLNSLDCNIEEKLE